jgi:hypothetical protein
MEHPVPMNVGFLLDAGETVIVDALHPVVILPITVSALGNGVPKVSVRLPAGSMMVKAPLMPVGIVNE